MDKIQEALNQAYVGEAKAALRLKVYAQKAQGSQGHGRKFGRQF